MMQGNLSLPRALPDWLPDAVRLYLDHTEDGLSPLERASEMIWFMIARPVPRP